MSVSRVHKTSSTAFTTASSLSSLKTATVEKLPMEMLEKVISYLPSYEARIASQVSRKWRAASEHGLKKACLADGIENPAGAKSWHALQADRERLARNWMRLDLLRLPTLSVEAEDESTRQYYAGNLQVGKRGVYLNDPFPAYIDLPTLGSDAKPTLRRLSASTSRLYKDRLFALRDGDGYIRCSTTTIAYYSGHRDESPVSSSEVDGMMICRAYTANLLLTSSDDELSVWTLPDLKLVSKQAINGVVQEASFSEDGKLILVRLSDGRLEALDTKGGWATISSEVRGLIPGSSPGIVNIRTPGQLHVVHFRSTPKLLYSLNVSSLTDVLATGVGDTYVCCVNTAHGTDVQLIRGSTNSRLARTTLWPKQRHMVGDVAVSPDGRWLTMLRNDQKVFIWDMLRKSGPV